MSASDSLTTHVALLLARTALGVVFLAHGAQKLFTYTLSGTASSFADMGIPVPQASAAFAAIVELVGGAALILGAGVTIAGLLLVADMLGALVLVHAPNGVFVEVGGFELVGALGAGALVLAVVGAGRFSVDHLVSSRRRAARRADLPARDVAHHRTEAVR